MKKISLLLIIAAIICTSCYQYVWVPIPGYGEQKPSETFEPDATTSNGLNVLLSSFSTGTETEKTIKIANGNYVLSDLIDVGQGKSLTIIGESDDAIISFDDSYFTADKIFQANSQNHFALISAEEGATLHLENITIKGKELDAAAISTGTEIETILAVDADVYLDGVTVEGVNWPDYFGMQTGFGLRTMGTSRENTITVKNSTFSGFQKCGILIASTADSSTNNDKIAIDGNTIIGAGDIDTIAQNGIQISTAKLSNIISVTGNSLSNLNYTKEGSSATGIMLVSAGNNNEQSAFEAYATELEANNNFSNVPYPTSVYI